MKKPLAKTKAPLPRVKCMFNLDPRIAAKIRDGATERGLSLSAFVTLAVEGLK